MNSEKLSEWLSIAANFGVVLGIIFLVLEINQSTKATVAAANDSVINGHLELSIPIITDPQVARMFALGLYQPDSLTDEEAVQFSMWLRQFVNQQIRIMQLMRRGLFSKSYEGGDVLQLARMLSTPGGKLFFEGNKEHIPRELLEELEPNLGQEMIDDFTLGRDWSIN